MKVEPGEHENGDEVSEVEGGRGGVVAAVDSLLVVFGEEVLAIEFGGVGLVVELLL